MTTLTPGPELERFIRTVCERLGKQTQAKADDAIRTYLADESKRKKFSFFDPNDIFYGYFMVQLDKVRTEIANGIVPQAPGKEPPSEAQAAASTAPPAVVAPTANQLISESLSKAMADAGRVRADPYPDVYDLYLEDGTISIEPPALLDYLTITAQYVSKCPSLLHNLQRDFQLHRDRLKWMQFLAEEDPRNKTFGRIVSAYETILKSDPQQASDRLAPFATEESFLRMCQDKATFLKAEVARKKAERLTDDELRATLQWDIFDVVHRFTAVSLGVTLSIREREAEQLGMHRYPMPPSTAELVGGVHRYPMPPSAELGGAQHRYPMPPSMASGGAAGGGFMSTSLLRPADAIGMSGMSGALPPAAPRFVQPPTMTAGAVVDDGKRPRTDDDEVVGTDRRRRMDTL